MDTNQYQQTNIWKPDSPPPAPIGPRPTSGERTAEVGDSAGSGHP